jgi:predicted dehydrogenase
VEFENNSTAQCVNIYIEGSWSFRNMCCFKVIGSKGEIKIKEDRIEIKDNFGNYNYIDTFHAGFLNINHPPGYTGFPQEILAMVRYIKENIKPFCDERIASESILIAQAAYLSEAKGRKGLTLDEFKEYSKKFNNNSELLLKELIENGITRWG